MHDVANLTVSASAGAQDVRRELRLAPGVWQARVVVTDTTTGSIGSALHTFEVRARTASSLGAADGDAKAAYR